MATVTTTFTFDTELSADSVEWCPIPGFKRFLVVGTYQVEKSEEASFSKSQRHGRIYLKKFITESQLQMLVEVDRVTLEAGVLDMKWSLDPKRCAGNDKGEYFSVSFGLTAAVTDWHVARGNPLLAVADSNGGVTLYGLFSREESETELIGLKMISKICLSDTEDTIALSLDWNLNHSNQLLVSDSKGSVTILELTATMSLEKVSHWKAHSFEAWIGVFDAWSPSTRVFSGGDDCKLRCSEVQRFSTTSSKVFELDVDGQGVTSLLSDSKKEFMLFSGGYGEYLYSWDTRSMKEPIFSKNLEGGIWRIRQLHRDTESRHRVSNQEKLLAIGAMNGGFYLINSENLEIVASYKDHDSLAYGIDFECNKCILEHDDKNSDEKCWIASCSFYDHTLKLWSCDSFV